MADLDQEIPKCKKGAPKWMVTFGDMMSLLLTFFVLLLSYANMDMTKYKEVLGSVEKAFGIQKEVFDLGKQGGMEQPIKLTKAKDKLIEEEKDQLINLLQTKTREERLKNTLMITPDKRGIKLEIAGHVMFEPGGAELLPSAERVFRSLIPIMRDTIYKIIVEGHTDDSPITNNQFPSNWELSSARAGAVVRYLINEGNLEAERFTTVGCANTKTLFPNDTPENRAKNRRVTIVFDII